MKELRKVLILSYFFPPSTFTGSFRIYSWAKHLSEFGYYPIIVTRNWDIRINEYKDMSASTTSEIIHKKFENYEVYFLPYKGNLRDRLYKKFGDKRMVLPRRILTSFEVVMQNFFIGVVPFNNLYHFSDDLLKKDQEIICLITSGKPYVLFHFCNKLAKKYQIPWIADYRDDWNTSQWLVNIPFNDRIVFNLEKRSERKWLSNSSFFTSISPEYVKNISGFIKKQGFPIMNGFDPDDYLNLHEVVPSDVFTILFNGTLYDSQPVEIFIDAFKLLINKSNFTCTVKLVFLGLNFEKKQAERIKKLLSGYERYFVITDRFDKNAALEIMAKAQVFLMFSHTNIKGVTSSKIFDYLALKKPIILCPTDNEILEEIILNTHSGYICNTSTELYDTLINLYIEFGKNGKILHSPDTNLINNYSRKAQTGNLSKALDDVFSGKLKNESLPAEKPYLRKVAFSILNNNIIRKALRNLNDGEKTIRLLCFHNISDKSDLAYPSLNPELFYLLIKYLNQNYDIISVSDIREKSSSIKRPLILTFDDGYKNFIEYALPILKQFNAPAINNIIVDCVENDRPFWTQRLNYDLSYIFRNHREIDYTWNKISIRNNEKVASPQQTSLLIYKKLLLLEQEKREGFLNDIENYYNVEPPENWGLMNWDEIKVCSENGVNIGSHTMTHNILTTIEDKEILHFEIADSKSVIEKHLGKSVETLTFPNGIYDDRCIEMARNAGYKYLMTTEEKKFKFNTNSSIQYPLILPRISINSNDNNENFLRVENFHNIVKIFKQN
jgi:peptidoglycan/xylan/chitin deacetylase (PgdA/CDA1 family)/glycosyltransferase involved in cell wall biosynthesis